MRKMRFLLHGEGKQKPECGISGFLKAVRRIEFQIFSISIPWVSVYKTP